MDKWWETHDNGETPKNKSFSAEDNPWTVFGIFFIIIGGIAWLTMRYAE